MDEGNGATATREEIKAAESRGVQKGLEMAAKECRIVDHSPVQCVEPIHGRVVRPKD